MHDESPGGQACKERTLAYWSDPKRFGPNANVPVQRKSSGFVGRWRSLVWHYIDGIDVMLNGR